jgi:hypothetical protein
LAQEGAALGAELEALLLVVSTGLSIVPEALPNLGGALGAELGVPLGTELEARAAAGR